MDELGNLYRFIISSSGNSYTVVPNVKQEDWATQLKIEAARLRLAEGVIEILEDDNENPLLDYLKGRYRIVNELDLE